VRSPRLATVWLVAVLAFWLVPSTASADHARAKMIERVNDARADNGLRALRSAPALARSSASFSHHLMKRDAFGHGNGVSASGFRGMGEALSLHFGFKPKVGGTVRRWLASPAHRAVVLKRGANWIGVGMTRGRFRGHRATIWVLQVGRR
jgi:uncharacterized protein YkwD